MEDPGECRVRFLSVGSVRFNSFTIVFILTSESLIVYRRGIHRRMIADVAYRGPAIRALNHKLDDAGILTLDIPEWTNRAPWNNVIELNLKLKLSDGESAGQILTKALAERDRLFPQLPEPPLRKWWSGR